MKCPKCHFENPDIVHFCGECGTQLISKEEIPVTETLETPTEELTTGSTFAGRYQIIEELGMGGMGRVYKVHDTEINEKVALKLLKQEIAADERIIERFRNELKIARKVSHKRVCRMYDIGKEEEKYFITMEYVEGEDLKSLIREKGKIPKVDVLKLAKQICEGLAEAHELGIVHRDLKPQNIMIDKEGNAKIMDFGIARSVEAPGVTQTGVMIGTPDYISPEQAEGADTDHKSDIYSLGVILYEMVTGRVPFKGDTALSVALKHKAQLPKDPRKLNPEVSENMSRLILVCMEKDRERRYQRAEELLVDMKNIEEGFPLGTKIHPRRKTIFATLIRKKLFIPALVAALAIIAVVVWQLLLKTPSMTSIAVLPFEDLSPQKDEDYLCDGIVEELINRLNKIENLWIPARTSSFSFKGKGLNIQEIGNKLNVDNVLEGSLRKSGTKLRITVRLVDVADNRPIWYESYNRDEGDVFDLQDEISLAIIENLKIKLLGEEKAGLVKRYTQNLEAYDLYLKGRYFWNKRTEESLMKGIEYFEQAIEEDPNYALAYAGLADSYNILGFYSALPPKEAYQKAKAAALKALELDDALSEAHTSLAYDREYHDWNWLASEKKFQRAIELNPSYAIAHHWYAEYLAAMGRMDEAIAEKKRALELDPLSLIVNASLGWIFYLARQYDQAIEQLRKTLELDPNFAVAHWLLGQIYEQKEMFKEAIVEFQEAITYSGGNSTILASLGHAYAVAGKRDNAMKVLGKLKELSKRKYVSSYDIAEIYIGIGEKDRAFEWLKNAYEEGARALVFLKVEPRLDSLRSDPRFTALLKKMNLE